MLGTTAAGKYGLEQRERVLFSSGLVYFITCGKSSPVQITIGQKQLETFEHINSLDSLINDSRSTRETKSNISITKAGFKNKNFS